MVSASVSQGTLVTGARIIVLRDILVRIVTKLVSVSQITISVILHGAVSVNQDTEGKTVPRPSQAWLFIRNLQVKTTVIPDMFSGAFSPS